MWASHQFRQPVGWVGPMCRDFDCTHKGGQVVSVMQGLQIIVVRPGPKMVPIMIDVVSTISWVCVCSVAISYPFPYPVFRATTLFHRSPPKPRVVSLQSIHFSKLPLTPLTPVAAVGLVISCGPPVEDSHSFGLMCPLSQNLLGTVADVGDARRA